MFRRTPALALLVAACVTSTSAASRVAKRVFRGDAAGMQERLANGGFEEVGDAETPAKAWDFWDQGYALEREIVRSGTRAARCTSTDAGIQYGAGQTVVLNQAEPVPIVAGGWSKAEEVSGSPGAGYSIYVDIAYTDGSHLWGRVHAFDTGTHDWQYGQVIIVPERPVRELIVYGLFRDHTGTVYFDDFSVGELVLSEGAMLFDGVPVTPGDAPPRPGEEDRLEAGNLTVTVDRATGAVIAEELPGGLLLRDVAGNSDFLQPTEASVSGTGDGLEMAAQCPEIDLELETSWEITGQALRIDGRVRDLRGEDRAVAVYLVLPVDFVGGLFGRDMRTSVPIEESGTFANTLPIGVGTNGRMSRYPIAPVLRDERGLCIATPLDEPRVSRLAYDAGSKELYAAFDLGLTPATTKFPSSASFSLVLYSFDSAWGFRSALRRYYDLFPESFVKRVEKEGIWMPFTDIATVQDPEDFGFMFKEGDNNVGWDEAHGIYTFVYVEPMSHWLPMAAEIPRTYEAAVSEVERRAATEAQSQATIHSGYAKPDGAYHLWITDAPWCDGALIATNPDPDLLSDKPDLMTQAKHEFSTIQRAFTRARRTDTAAWRDFGGGFEFVTNVAHSGERSVRCTNAAGEIHGLSQTVLLKQEEPREFVARAWSRAEGVTGPADIDYSLYLDLVYSGGTPSYAHTAPFRVGTHDWQQAEVVVRPEKPVHSLTLHLLFRRQHSGTVWFDDVSLTEKGSDENPVREAGFEPGGTPVRPAELDGTYIDSYEMAATTQNYRREQWAYADVPLTFSLTTRDVCSLGIFHTYEFERELARRMHGRGKLTFANAVLMNFGFPAHLLDVMGIETNWAPGGNYTPNSDETMNFRRALCCQKPYLLLLNTDYDAFEPQWVELYFKRCTFYAIFPSFFSHNAADDPYWQNPALYNRDRPIFQRYIPVICALNAAGWRPITHARVTGGDGKVYVERFGSDPAAGLYFTLFNDSDQAREYTLRIEAGELGLGDALAQDVLDAGPVSLDRQGDALTISGTLDPEDMRVIALKTK